MRGREYRIGPGASSLLLIVLTLALATLAMLSLMTARADIRLSIRARDMTVAYQNAAAHAQERLRELDECLFGARKNIDSVDEYFEEVERSLPEWAELQNQEITFHLDADGERLLRVAIWLYEPDQSVVRYEITAFELIDGAEWETEILNLM